MSNFYCSSAIILADKAFGRLYLGWIFVPWVEWFHSAPCDTVAKSDSNRALSPFLRLPIDPNPIDESASKCRKVTGDCHPNRKSHVYVSNIPVLAARPESVPNDQTPSGKSTVGHPLISSVPRFPRLLEVFFYIFSFALLQASEKRSATCPHPP